MSIYDIYALAHLPDYAYAVFFGFFQYRIVKRKACYAARKMKAKGFITHSM